MSSTPKPSEEAANEGATYDREAFEKFLEDQRKNISVQPNHFEPLKRTKHPLVLIIGNTQNLMDQTFNFACGMAGYDPKKKSPFKKSTVIFVERKITSNYLAIFFQLNGYRMEPLNSDYTALHNRETLQRMMRGEIQGVVATNKLSRGQDIPEVDHVIVYEMAQSFDDYTHRLALALMYLRVLKIETAFQSV
ncbi:helicase protein [Ancylostoma ceylanicum]|uniref:Helicase protein n=1 Tax=Ancylostoma ceylanicum TaxID=53326 RepID=A0A0D6LRS7_9BILA|nr:helicase protein [Ancylostoma ceylanicum]